MPSASLSVHAQSADGAPAGVLRPRLRQLHARIGRAHHQAEGMAFSRALLEERATPAQLVALLRALAPAYALIEARAPELSARLGVADGPWEALSRRTALAHDLALLSAAPASPPSAAAARWHDRLRQLADDAPHRFMAHAYVRYGGDLSGGQQLAPRANAILRRHGLPALSFWVFDRPVAELKEALHGAFERFVLTEAQEAQLLDEAEDAFRATQSLLAELATLAMHDLHPSPAASLSHLDLLRKYDRPVPRYTSYPTAAAFHAGVGAPELAAQLAIPSEARLSLYVHVPFCRHACWYCGCHRVTTQLGSKVVEPYLASLARELELVTAAMPRRRQLAQLHWGGGTPNYLTSAEATALWRLIESHFSLAPELEASIEVNPELLDRDGVMALRQLGFNRVSFGIQDAHPEVQRAVNRVVPAEQLRRVMSWLREADVRSVNVDLICGLPLQTPERFRTTLELVRELRPDRLSLFSFAYLPQQLPLQQKIDPAALPTPLERLTLLDQAQQWVCGHGYTAIGLDHYALADDSLALAAKDGRLHRNFQGYTTGGEHDVLGLGPSAISQFPHLFTQNHTDLKAYMADLERGVLPVARGLVVRDPEVLERRQLIRDVMCRFQTRFDPRRYPLEWEHLLGLARDGLVWLEAKDGIAHLEVSREGRWLLRTIAAVFDPQQRLAARGAGLV